MTGTNCLIPTLVVIIFSLDWEKAFDNIPHERLLLKLRNAGIKGSMFEWFKCYLNGRKQRVLCGGYFSDSMIVPSGVIQGSVLGPLLFNIIVADLPKWVSSKNKTVGPTVGPVMATVN
jgi:ribonuclease P/MRP protein subunit RPP40